MKRFTLAVALACILSGSVLADDGNMGGTGFQDDGNMGNGNIVASDGNMGQGDFTDDGNQGTSTSAVLLTILDLMF